MTDETAPPASADPTKEGPTNLAIAPDGVPFILLGANEAHIRASSLTTYYFTD